MFVNQHKYTQDLICRALLHNTIPGNTPSELKWSTGEIVEDIFQSSLLSKKLVGSPVCLTITWPDILHAVNIVSQSMH